MGNLYEIIIVILFLLAITDLVVGVSNDAVNFLVSAFGSKVSKRWVILLVASFGVLVGAIFSSGMMEVARKGIFHPEKFVFAEIILIFLAVMLTDIIMLDFFNTFGFPTSTTVSLVFELLGAAVAIALYKTGQTGESLAEYINSGRALVIISGILFSIVVAFTIGALVQWITRVLFTFQYEKNYKYFGAIWGGLSLTAIIFFMFLKGFKGSSLKDTEFVQWILNHQGQVILISFVSLSVLFQILYWLFRINILKTVVLAGTFALAMAFAGNDLVNFIGVPIAGYSSYDLWSHSGVPADQFTMEGLSGNVSVPPIFLITAGLIMTIVLWTSRKAKTVTETSINLARQDTGYERFGSTLLSRSLVRAFINTVNFFRKITPPKVNEWLENRFVNPKKTGRYDPKAPAFDLIRASVNLVVSSILIAIGTAYKLPLSTTYVTFMVAMGTSLADRAWGRESAVYRVTGVISVITGWFFTAFIAFSVAFLVATALYFGRELALGLLIGLDIFLFYRSRIIHKRRVKEEEEAKRRLAEESAMTKDNVFEKCTENTLNELKKLPEILRLAYDGFSKSDRKILKKAVNLAETFKDKTKSIKSNIYNIIQLFGSQFLLSAQYYVQEVDSLREIANAAVFFARRLYEHIDNNHEIFNKEQMEDFADINEKVINYVKETIEIIEKKNFSKLNAMRDLKTSLLRLIEEYKTLELQRIQNEEVDTINSNLYLHILGEYKNMLLFSVRLLKAHNRFVRSKNKVLKETN